MSVSARPTAGTAAVGGVAVAAAAAASACLFLLELVAGKALLPRFGGAPGAWVSCLAFFQLALVAASAHADLLIRRHGPRLQLLVQATVFAMAAAATPLGLAAVATMHPESILPLPLVVLLALAISVGPAFFAIAALAPLFGHWRSLWPDAGRDQATGGRAARTLYAAGNAGSFAVLAAYPTLIEPHAGIGSQVDLATRLYLCVALLTVLIGSFTVAVTRRSATVAHPAQGPVVSRRAWWRWAFLAAVPASWLAAVTTRATVEVAPMPLLWIVPLAIYLASFVVVFSPVGRRLRRFEGPALLGAACLTAWMVAADVDEPIGWVLTAHFLAFGVACIAIHGRLVDEQPAPERLSTFYLALATGGAAGGLWNALVAPAVFDAHHEFPLAIAAAAGLAPAVFRWQPHRRLAAVAAVTALVAGCLLAAPWFALPRTGWLAVLAASVATLAATLTGVERAVALFGLTVATFLVGESSRHVVHRERTFFGVLRVCESPNGPSRLLMHGGIRHGVQLVSDDPERRRIPLSYYHEAGPLGSIFRTLVARGRHGRVGIAGLGVGTIASYAAPGQEFVFFEIDPAVVRLAQEPRWFTYLADSRGRTRVVTDDARRALEREADGSLDLLVVDAFTGDSVPTHLLTREAFALYGRKLTADGILALHVSNKYLDFVPIVEAVAADGGWMGLVARDLDVGADAARLPSEWMGLSRSLEVVQAIYARPTSDRWCWQPCADVPATRAWTDDRTAVIEALWHRRRFTAPP
jgi:hypothetical protein